MTRKSPVAAIMLSVVVCAAVMSYTDAVIQPGYAVKSAFKAVLFLMVPLRWFFRNPQGIPMLKKLLIPEKRSFLTALVLGVGVYGLILGGYYGISLLLDLTEMILNMTAQGGVSPANFLWVSLYISFVNSFLEEFLFRGYAFLVLKEKIGRFRAYSFSAAMFALYHFGMFAGAVNVPIWIAALSGLFVAGVVLNWLNERSGNIYTSWIVHMFANFSINTVGFLVFGMI